MKKRVLLVLLSLIMVFSLVGCKSKKNVMSPEDSIEGYLTSLVNFDEEGIKKYLADGLSVDGLFEKGNKAMLESSDIVKLVQDIKASVKSKDISGDEATYVIELDAPHLGVLITEAMDYLKEKTSEGEEVNLTEFFKEKIENEDIGRNITEAEFLLKKVDRGWVIIGIINDDNVYGMHGALEELQGNE